MAMVYTWATHEGNPGYPLGNPMGCLLVPGPRLGPNLGSTIVLTISGKGMYSNRYHAHATDNMGMPATGATKAHRPTRAKGYTGGQGATPKFPKIGNPWVTHWETLVLVPGPCPWSLGIPLVPLGNPWVPLGNPWVTPG